MRFSIVFLMYFICSSSSSLSYENNILVCSFFVFFHDVRFVALSNSEEKEIP